MSVKFDSGSTPQGRQLQLQDVCVYALHQTVFVGNANMTSCEAMAISSPFLLCQTAESQIRGGVGGRKRRGGEGGAVNITRC